LKEFNCCVKASKKTPLECGIYNFTNPLYQVRFYPDGKSLIVNSMGVEIVLYRTE
jgi:hypothetical protein